MIRLIDLTPNLVMLIYSFFLQFNDIFMFTI